MYIMRLEDDEMIFIERRWYDEQCLGALMKYSGAITNNDIQSFISTVFEYADGNPIQIPIPLDEKYLNVIKDLGLLISNKGYLYSQHLSLKVNEATALKLLRDGYTIKFNQGDIEIC